MKLKLNSLKDMNEKVCSDFIVCVVEGRKFLEGMRREHMYFSIIPKVDNEEVEEVLA